MTALHGFLGRPQDWEPIACTIEAIKPSWMPVLAGISDGPPLWALADLLNREPPKDGALLGYSMGGRIALHMLLANSEMQPWKRAIIVSASPGLAEGEDRAARLASDLRWADRFRIDPWENVVRDWNAQSVFSNDTDSPSARKECDFVREHVAKALVLGSVAGQEDLRPRLRKLNLPILWIAGERDAKYSALAKECAALSPDFGCRIIPGAGHRVPWTHAEAFCQIVTDFLDNN